MPLPVHRLWMSFTLTAYVLVCRLSSGVAGCEQQSTFAAPIDIANYRGWMRGVCMQGSQAEHNAALQEVCALQQQAVFHLKGLRTLVDSSGAAAAEEAAEGGGTASYDAETVQRFSGCNVGEQIAILEEHLLQMLLVPAADAALRYVFDHAF